MVSLEKIDERESELIEMVKGCMEVCGKLVARIEALEASLHMTHDDQHREEDGEEFEEQDDQIWV